MKKFFGWILVFSDLLLGSINIANNHYASGSIVIIVGIILIFVLLIY